jgi:HrpA-like RNA helicase
VEDYLESGKNNFMEWKSDPTEINELGVLLAKIPVSPKYAKMLIASHKYGILRYCIMIVACMSVSELFTN